MGARTGSWTVPAEQLPLLHEDYSCMGCVFLMFVLRLSGSWSFTQIAKSIHESGYFSLEADEVTDTSNKEQLVVCLRWVDSQFEPHEFI